MSTFRKTVRIEFLEHPASGLLVAVSEDMRGLYVHGETPEQLTERIPVAIRALLEAEGNEVIEVVPVDEDLEDTGFVSRVRKFDAALAA